MTAKELMTTIADESNKAAMEAEKFDDGNKAAGTRLRKNLQKIKAQANDLRKYVTETTNARKQAKGAAAD